MALTSPAFLLFALCVVLLGNAFTGPLARQYVLAAGSIVFIASYTGGAMQLLPFAAFLLLCYLLVIALQWRPSPWRLGLGLAVLVPAFLYLKQYSFLSALPVLPFVYLSLGLSYILFRVIHLMVDASQGNLPQRIDPLAFFNYSCNFLSLVSGPVQRYEESFAAQREPAPVLDEASVFAACARVLRGYVKVAIVSAFANYAFGHLSARLFEQAAAGFTPGLLVSFIATILSYTLYLYANFSGYMDIVIGIGRLFGCALPENFDRPFQARNFLDFWSRWHITLSTWFKTYVFNPLLKLMAGRITAPALQPWLGVVAFFLTFLLMGMWHGSSEVFLVYGLAMGAGASLNKLWQVLMQRRLGKPGYKALAANPIYATLCRGMTCAWFAMALACFWLDLTQLRQLAAALGAAGLVTVFVLTSLLTGLALVLGDLIGARLHATADGLLQRWQWARAALLRNLGLGLQVVLIASVASLFHKAPEFVYRAF